MITSLDHWHYKTSTSKTSCSLPNSDFGIHFCAQFFNPSLKTVQYHQSYHISCRDHTHIWCCISSIRFAIFESFFFIYLFCCFKYKETFYFPFPKYIVEMASHQIKLSVSSYYRIFALMVNDPYFRTILGKFTWYTTWNSTLFHFPAYALMLCIISSNSG